MYRLHFISRSWQPPFLQRILMPGIFSLSCRLSLHPWLDTNIFRLGLNLEYTALRLYIQGSKLCCAWIYNNILCAEWRADFEFELVIAWRNLIHNTAIKIVFLPVGIWKRSWTNGRLAIREQLGAALAQFRFWYNHVRPHQNLVGRTQKRSR